MYRGDPRGGSGDTEDRCRGRLPLAVSRLRLETLCDQNGGVKLLPVGLIGLYAKSFRANVTAPSCLCHAARPLLPTRGEAAPAYTRTRSMNTCNS